MISKILKILVNSKFIFFRPTKKKVIIYDNNYSELLVSYFKSYDILHTRFEKINIFILLKSFFINGFKNIHFNYKKTYINFVNPDLLITFTDNDLDFLQFKFKKIKKIAIQGAYRRETFPDLFSILKYEKKKNII
jgi:surface carbohydrate biosynthesis protein